MALFVSPSVLTTLKAFYHSIPQIRFFIELIKKTFSEPARMSTYKENCKRDGKGKIGNERLKSERDDTKRSKAENGRERRQLTAKET